MLLCRVWFIKQLLDMSSPWRSRKDTGINFSQYSRIRFFSFLFFFCFWTIGLFDVILLFRGPTFYLLLGMLAERKCKPELYKSQLTNLLQVLCRIICACIISKDDFFQMLVLVNFWLFFKNSNKISFGNMYWCGLLLKVICI